MSLNESIVEDAALAMPMAALIPAFSQRAKEAESAAIRRLNPALNLNWNDPNWRP